MLVAVGEQGIARYTSDGRLDPSFGTEGMVLYPYYAKAVALQANGAIVIAGGTSATNSDQMVVSRYLANGTIDTTFDLDGHALIDFGTGTEIANGVAIAPNGRIVVAGVSDRSIAAARLLTSGALDPTFDGDGKFTRQLYTTANVANAVTVQPDGKLLLAGSTWQFASTSSNHDAFVMRLNASGTLDRTFNSTGVSYIQASRYDDAKAMTLLADGKIVVSGSTNANFRSNVLVSRLNADGTLDSSFDFDGTAFQAISGFSTDTLGGETHLVQSDGSIIVAAGGRLMSFDSSGAYQASSFVAVFGFQSIASLKTTADQKLMLIGTAFSRFAVGRLNTDRTYDTSFSGDGVAPISIGASDDVAGRSVILADGKVLVPSTSQGTFAVTRFNADGTLDTSFSQDGKLTIPLGNQFVSARATAVAVQPDGRMIVVGQASQMATISTIQFVDSDFAMVRLNQDGTLDSTFGNGGVVITSLNGFASPSVVKLQSNGRILVGGQGEGGYLTVVRYLANGALDRSFSGDGIFSLVSPNVSSASVNDLVVQPDGKIVAVGEQSPLVTRVYPSNLVILRLNANGSLDRTFGTNGRITPASLMRTATRVLLDNDGSIIVGGNAVRFQNGSLFSQMVLTRYSALGEFIFEYPVPQFEETSSFNPTLTFPVNSTLKSLALQSDGKVVAAGVSNRSPVVVRVNRDGTPDSTFDGDGRSKLSLPTSGVYAPADLLVQTNGKFLLVGSYRPDGLANQDLLISRVDAAAPTGPSTQVTLNSAGQIEIRDRWARNDLLVVKQVGDQLEITDFTSDSNAKFSVVNLPTVTGDGTKQLLIPLSLIAQTQKPLLISALGGDDQLVLDSTVGDDASMSLTFAAGIGKDHLFYSSSSLASVWRVNALGSGTLTPSSLAARAFSQVEAFTGSVMEDEFRVTAGNTSTYMVFDGNTGGADSLQVTGDADFKVTNNLLAITGGVSQNVMQYRFEKLTLQGGVSANILDASGFTGTSVLIGGDGDDLLIAGGGNDELRGGLGHDILYAGEGSDQLFGENGDDILSGDGGDDLLNGGNGHDILIGGFGADTLRGGTGQDILIAGYGAGVYHPNDTSRQLLLRSVWSNTSLTYATRVDQLLNVGVGPEAYKLLPNFNVFDDVSQDSLSGDAHQDWFFANQGTSGVGDLVNDRLSDELISLLG